MLTKEQQEELTEAFELFDRDGDGAIGPEELANVLALLGQDAKEEELAALLDAADRDKNGVIDKQEFVDLMAKYLYFNEVEMVPPSATAAGGRQRPSEEAEMAAAFKVFDRDGDGLIGPEELRLALLGMGEGASEDQVKAMIRAADQNDDGMIDFDEFKCLIYGK